MTRRRVLFIDDDPRILEGIARLLRPRRAQVEVLTAVGGEEALALLGREEIDVVISDMRMPRMDGAELLTEVRRRHPQIARLILSGQSDRETILRAVGPAHQFLSKPCDPEVLTATTLRACALRDLVADAERQRGIAGLCGLPCRHQALADLRAALAEPSPSTVRVADIVAADLGLAAKLVQLTATSFFGSPRGTTTPRQAVQCLGLDVLRSLAVGTVAFPEDPADDDVLAGISVQAAQRAACARGLATRHAPNLANEAEVAGLLVSCGQLLPGSGSCSLGADGTCPSCDAAAFLLGLWGLSDAVVEAVQRHRLPSRSTGRHDRLTAILHAATVQVDSAVVDQAFLRGQGIELVAGTGGGT